MRRAIGWLIIAFLVFAVIGWAATKPRALSAEEIAVLPVGDAARGEAVFWAGGCTSCHAAAGASGEDRLRLGGGRELATPFGTFVAPNISPDPADGIGAWSEADFANAMLRGVSPEGLHFYPAFPYASYARMTPEDIADLWAFLGTLPAMAGKAPPHRLTFPFSIRRGVGLWKLLFLSQDRVASVDATDPLVARGQYLVEGPGHCGECHTPRGRLGEMDTSRWLAGGPAPEGAGRIPNITPGGPIGDWSADDIITYFETGFTPDFDSVGGSMAEVQRNLAMLPSVDREAITAYLKAVPSLPSGAPGAG